MTKLEGEVINISGREMQNYVLLISVKKTNAGPTYNLTWSSQLKRIQHLGSELITALSNPKAYDYEGSKSVAVSGSQQNFLKNLNIPLGSNHTILEKQK